ncbi:sulfatase/phosphatase domain-containing protein [Crateriforma conspicua]|uniref:sulfatase/phosphatase domain-containing protein n=1 Tax=Crateriforma conspicua TaxID=2527996 RepID=UPI0011893B27|nr:sulfatase/phosphatase domain-containing protein [Crateriforma conspicua]QDV64698.1 Arylsulfatase [Crateriforma conspicua]
MRLGTPPALRTAAILALLTATAFGHRLATANDDTAKRPNILFVFSDDHATQAIGAYGSKINQTPHLDRIASDGMLFRNSFCANSICGPSRACILTGKHSHINGFRRNGNRFDGSQVTFPKLLQDVGYQTALIGKWHLGTDPTGFDHWEVLPGQGNYYNPVFLQMGGDRKQYEGYVTDIITEQALDWLKNRDEDKPFLMMCQHKAPHRNWSPPPRHFSLYKDTDVPVPETLFDDYQGRSELLKENEMSIADHMYWQHDMKFQGENQFPEHFASGIINREYQRMTDQQKAAWDAAYGPENEALIKSIRDGSMSEQDIVRWKYQRYIKDYLRCVQAVDDSVGQLLNYLDDSGLAENTIVIYSSDQGFYLGEHGWYDKRWMFEESLQMPFIIRWPGKVKSGVESKALIQNIDYAPTFLEIAGAGVPDEIQGRSMVSMLKNEGKATSDWRDAIYYAYYENAAVHNVPLHDGVRTDRYKLMYFARTRQWNLFDLQTDPLELKSVHDDPQYASILLAMQKRYWDLRVLYDVNTATIPATRGTEKWWADRFQSQTRRASQGNADLAFIGDSITQGWEGAGKKVWQEFYGDRSPINLGISGDRTEHVIWRLDKGKVNKLNPKVAVVMIGTNNTGHLMQSPDQVAQGVTAIIEDLRQRWADTQILLLGIFPRGAAPFDLYRLNNIAINDRIRKLADGSHVHYMDIGDVFLESDGTISKTIMPDQLHLSEAGYRLWAEAIEPKLKDLGL